MSLRPNSNPDFTMERVQHHPYSAIVKDDATGVEFLLVEFKRDDARQSTGLDDRDSARKPGYHQLYVVPGWPHSPRDLKRKWWKKGTLLVDVAIALIPLVFIGWLCKKKKKKHVFYVWQTKKNLNYINNYIVNE